MVPDLNVLNVLLPKRLDSKRVGLRDHLTALTLHGFISLMMCII